MQHLQFPESILSAQLFSEQSTYSLSQFLQFKREKIYTRRTPTISLSTKVNYGKKQVQVEEVIAKKVATATSIEGEELHSEATNA